MVSKIVDRAAAFCVHNHWISPEDKGVYQLGMDVAISTLLQTTVILGVGFIVHNVMGSVLYLIVMQNIRSSSGGYHARTRTGCLSVMVVTYLVSRYVPIWIMSCHIEMPYCVACALCSNLVFFLWVPIKNDKKVLKQGWRPVARKRAIVCLELWIVLSVGMYFVQQFWTVQVMTMLLIISLLIVVCIVGRRKHNEEECNGCSHAEGCQEDWHGNN